MEITLLVGLAPHHPSPRDAYVSPRDAYVSPLGACAPPLRTPRHATPLTPSAQVAYTCTSGQCVQQPGGLFSNATACHASCFTRYACEHNSQTCSISSYGAYAGKDACLSICRTAACTNYPYAQCGGTTWKGLTCCPSGYECHGQGYYFQCVPSSSSVEAAEVEAVVVEAAEVEAVEVKKGNGFVPRYTDAATMPTERRYQYHSSAVL